MLPLTDILSLILGIFLTIRKLDVARREPEAYASVATEAFEAWKREESSVYRIASTACFLKVAAGFLLYVFARHMSWGAVRWIDAGVHVAWILALGASLLVYRRALATRRRLGIVLVAPPPEEDHADDEPGH